MANEYIFPYTASEIAEKLGTVDEIDNNLKNDYYTAVETNTKLETKADLVDGKIPKSQLPDNIDAVQVQADFAQNDDSQPDYIKNRLAYSEGLKNKVLFNEKLTFFYNSDMGVYMADVEGISDDFVNEYSKLGDVTITYDRKTYSLEKYYMDGVGGYGNPAIFGFEPNDVPFLLFVQADSYENVLGVFSLTDPAPEDPDNAPTIEHSVKLSYLKESVYTDSRYFNIESLLTVNEDDVLPGWTKKKYVFSVESDSGMGYVEEEAYRFLPIGKKVKVYWDGVEYPCKVQEVEEMIAIGNFGLMTDGTPTDEPFIIATDNNSKFYIIYSLDTNPLHEVYITAGESLQKKIDSEYLNMNLEADDYPEYESENLITSGAVYRALGNSSSVSVENGVYPWSERPISSSAVYYALGGRERLNIDSSVSSYSDNLVTSRAIYEAIENKSITTDSYLSSSSNNAISNSAVYNALQNKVDKTAVDTTVSSTSSNPVANKAVYNALQNKLDKSSVISYATANSTSPITSGGVYSALFDKQDRISVSSADNGKFMRVVNGRWAAATMLNAEDGEF